MSTVGYLQISSKIFPAKKNLKVRVSTEKQGCPDHEAQQRYQACWHHLCFVAWKTGWKTEIGNLRIYVSFEKGRKHCITNPKKIRWWLPTLPTLLTKRNILGGLLFVFISLSRWTKSDFSKASVQPNNKKYQNMWKRGDTSYPKKNHGTGIIAYMNSWFVW